jgi:hypothetical protein
MYITCAGYFSPKFKNCYLYTTYFLYKSFFPESAGPVF